MGPGWIHTFDQMAGIFLGWPVPDSQSGNMPRPWESQAIVYQGNTRNHFYRFLFSLYIMTAVRRFSLVRGDWKLSQLRRKSEIYLYLPSHPELFLPHGGIN